MFRNIKEMLQFRALIWALVGRHLHTRYRGSIFGFLWSFLNPLCLIAVYSLVFRYYIRAGNVEHYTLFLFTGMLPWIWFSSGLLGATGSISGGGSLITKAMFPPHVLPTVEVITNLANFAFALPILIGLMFAHQVYPGISMLALPLVVLIEFIFLLGLALMFSALNVRFRDLQHILGNILTLWFFLTPILYPVSNIPEQFKFTMTINPLALFTEMYQGIFLENKFPDLQNILLTAALSLLIFWLGNSVFNRHREEFAELV
ncbi:ABC transporter permease [bacterium]|nr:ABC transporter permease [bacterium]